MPTGDAIILIIALVLLMTLTWRVVYLYFTQNNGISDTHIMAIRQVRSILNNTINGGNAQTLQTPENLKKLKIKKSKILNKLDELTELISDKTGIPIRTQTIHDPFLDEIIKIKELDDDKLRVFALIGDYSTIKAIIKQLVSENIFPTNSDFEYINSIYKKFKKMTKK